MIARKKAAQLLLLLLAFAMIAAGAIQGDYNGVRKKAVMICRECIGIG